ncbi:MAG: Ada metal-binding domain-containing protein [Pseudomonadota bacterium]
MFRHHSMDEATLASKIAARKISLAGNERLKIYGSLDCKSGKRMKRENRVFFTDEQEAVALGYRPCGNCMKTAYQQWRGRSEHVRE